MTRAEKAAKYFQPLQVGIATRSGTDTVVHGVRRALQKFGRSSEYAMLTVDLKNAFNLCSRPAFLEAVKHLFPELFPWVADCYAHEPAFLWIDRHVIHGIQGTQQGNNLGGLLFDLALHPIILKIQQLLRSGDDEVQQLGNLLFQLWYHDDGYIIARHDQLRNALDILSSSEATTRGLHLAVPKCRIWRPTPPQESVQRLYPTELKQEYSEGTVVLNAPVGSTDFTKQYFTDHF